MASHLGIEYRHGQELNDGLIVFVGPDGVARSVTQDMFNLLEETRKRNEEFVAGQNEVMAKGDLWGIVGDVTTLTAAIRCGVDAMSPEEIEQVMRERSKMRR